jgi:hypothetical protein
MVVPVFVPQALAFPYHAQSHGSSFWSERPIPQPELDAVAGRGQALVAQSPLAKGREPRHVFLTQGGWRWKWLVLANRSAFGITRPIAEAVILNRNDLAKDEVLNGAAIGGRRTLSGAIAHETCHGMLRRHFGLSVASKPTWLTEGYCDHVAQESSLTAADAARLETTQPGHPALPYFHGRLRVARLLQQYGGDVDAIFAAH